MAFRLLIIACLSCLVGCAVYSPTVPCTPLVQKGQVELAVSMRTLFSVDGSAAYSPINHLLVSTEGAVRRGGGNMTVNGAKEEFTDLHRQGSLGLGAYQEFGPDHSFYVAAVGGVGVAAVNVHNGLVGTLAEYTANYTRYYGQVYVAQRGKFISGGFSMRINWLTYSRLALDNVPVDPMSHYYLEPSLFVRAGKGALQSQLTVGVSMPDHTSSGYGANILAARSSLVSLGLVFLPALLTKRGDVAR